MVNAMRSSNDPAAVLNLSPRQVPPEPPLARLQALLRELFQYDYADLDFGI